MKNNPSANQISEFSDEGCDSQEPLTQQIYTTLRDEIAKGELEPGTKLVRRQLSKRLGVSTIPVMEALRLLENDGLVQHRIYSGTCVRQFAEQGLRDDIQLREALESQVARLCASQAQTIGLNHLYYLAGQVDGAMMGNGMASAEGMQLHMSFHMALARAANCKPLYQQLEKLWYREMMLTCWASSGVKTVPANWHLDMVKIIVSGDVQQADEQARKHVTYGREEFIAHLYETGQLQQEKIKRKRRRKSNEQ